MGVVENHSDFARDKTIRDILNYLEMSYGRCRNHVQDRKGDSGY